MINLNFSEETTKALIVVSIVIAFAIIFVTLAPNAIKVDRDNDRNTVEAHKAWLLLNTSKSESEEDYY